ncbi:ArsA family ATPase [Antrihabitans cavernicola]|uniref:ArsA family ATPase n=1 Tax=Antrihabitans cavernicola TaxID=2495913 RepID=A0A5A7SF02_9NOCA|nr:ArsA family ATPase [Spelaeibacter cavernicola]
MGKGGTGKTTLACATAISRARAGERVLLASIDQAHSLGDALDVNIPHEPGTTAGVRTLSDGLDIIEIDTLALLEDRFRGISTMLSMGEGHNHGAEFGTLDPAELTGLPGAQQLLGLSEIVELADDDAWDIVIVDCAATAETLSTLASPESLLGYLERIWPQHKRVTAAIGTDLQMAVVVAATERIAKSVAVVRDLLVDRTRTGARLVTVPERVTLAETARIRSASALLGLRLDAVVVNKVLPPLDPPGVPQTDDGHPAIRWYRSRRREQLEVIADLERAMGDVPIVTAQHTGPEPVGLAALGALAYSVSVDPGSASRDEDPTTVAVELESGTGLESVYAMRMYLPVAQPSSLRLGRVEDDLIVGADGIRRRVRLASVLRRCTVAGAELEGDRLVVRFQPDASVWPR